MSKINHFKYYKTSPEIIKLAVMYYVRNPLSLRNVEDILHERGIDICHETVRYWWNKPGPVVAKDLKKKRKHGPQNGDGISMKFLSKSMEKHITFGALLIMKALSLIAMFLNVEIAGQLSDFLEKRLKTISRQSKLSRTN